MAVQTKPKDFQVQNAVYWLGAFKRKAEGRLSYVNPHIYTMPACVEVLSGLSIEEIFNVTHNSDKADLAEMSQGEIRERVQWAKERSRSEQRF